MVPTAYVLHRVRGRVRFRIRERRRDTGYFESLRSRLGALPGFDVHTNPARGTVLVVHPDMPYEELSKRLDELRLFHVADGPEPHPPALSFLFAGFEQIDKQLLSGSDGSVDLRTLVFIAALALAIRQMSRGDIISPALPLLWSAMEMASRFAGSHSGDEYFTAATTE